MEKEIIQFEKYDLPIKIKHLSMKRSGTYRGSHSHGAVEIVEVKSGVLNCCVDDRILRVFPGQILFINGNKGHRLYSDDAQIIYLHVDARLLDESTGDDEFSMLYAFIAHTQAKPCLLFTDNEEIKALLQKLNEKYHGEAKENRWYIKAYLYELLAFMYAQSFITHSTVPKDQINKIRQVVHYIDANFQSPVMLDDICAAAKYNKYTVCHIFKALTGATIFDYINFLRANYAVERLRSTDNSILEIATECGFSSATYFNRVFRSFFGCSPSVYRKLLPESIIG